MKICEIAEQLRKQDNRGTDQPMFVVQQEVKDWHIDLDEADGYEWFDSEEWEPVTDDLILAQLEHGNVPNKYRQHGFRRRWEFVTACFTEQGCKDFLKINGHNLAVNTRIYALGSYRNNEFRAVREMLINTPNDRNQRRDASARPLD